MLEHEFRNPLKYLSTKEAAEFLRVSEGHIRNLVSQGRLQRLKPFGRLLFKKSDLERVIESSRMGGLNVR